MSRTAPTTSSAIPVATATHPIAALPSLARACAGEAVGTYILAFFGCGSVMSAVITGAQVGLWQVAVVWGFGVSLAIYATAAASGAHLNPAVTLSSACSHGGEWSMGNDHRATAGRAAGR